MVWGFGFRVSVLRLGFKGFPVALILLLIS